MAPSSLRYRWFPWRRTQTPDPPPHLPTHSAPMVHDVLNKRHFGLFLIKMLPNNRCFKAIRRLRSDDGQRQVVLLSSQRPSLTLPRRGPLQHLANKDAAFDPPATGDGGQRFNAFQFTSLVCGKTGTGSWTWPPRPQGSTGKHQFSVEVREPEHRGNFKACLFSLYGTAFIDVLCRKRVDRVLSWTELDISRLPVFASGFCSTFISTPNRKDDPINRKSHPFALWPGSIHVTDYLARTSYLLVFFYSWVDDIRKNYSTALLCFTLFFFVLFCWSIKWWKILFRDYQKYSLKVYSAFRGEKNQHFFFYVSKEFFFYCFVLLGCFKYNLYRNMFLKRFGQMCFCVKRGVNRGKGAVLKCHDAIVNSLLTTIFFSYKLTIFAGKPIWNAAIFVLIFWLMNMQMHTSATLKASKCAAWFSGLKKM